MSELTPAERQRMTELKSNIRSEMERINSKPLLKTTGEEALDALVNHVTGAFGWREMNRSDDGDTVTLYNGRDFLDIGLTPAEVVDSISEATWGAHEEREFNAND